MQNNPNQTNQKDPDNRVLDESDTISEQLRTLWCLYCTKLAPISKTNDVARSACVVKRN